MENRKLLDWFARHGRILPWRGHPDPYAVWVSEIMLQQTRVETVTAYFERWMVRFPTIQTLASASQQEVLAAWEGLGYYGRARNLHRAAQVVITEYGGRLPSEVHQLRRLPGIGRYTAAAIAALAFGRDEAALDGNIRRVLARLYNVTEPEHSSAGERLLWELAARDLPPGRAADYNQALMDLGASVCTPRAPDCVRCPLNDECLAYRGGVQEQRPVKPVRRTVPHHTVAAAVVQRNGTVLIAQRPQTGLLGGLWEFPGGKLQDGEDLPGCLRRELREELGVEVEVGKHLGVFRHAYTHFRVTLHAFHCGLAQGEPVAREASQVRWVTSASLSEYPMGKIDRQISSLLNSPGVNP